MPILIKNIFRRHVRGVNKVGSELRRQDLESDLAAELGVGSAVDLTHATGAEESGA